MSTDAPTIVICDDDPNRADTWKTNIESIPGIRDFNYEVIDGDRLVHEIDLLARRRDAARGTADSNDTASVFDTAAIAVLDYDLTPDASMASHYTPSSGQASFQDIQDQLRGRTGERVAYLARCYSTVGYLVVVNQGIQQASFDLTMKKFSSSKADLNVTAEELVTAALWTGQNASSVLNAWSWPVLQDAADLWNARLTGADLRAPVLATLGLDPGEEHLAARQVDILTESVTADQPKSPADITFDDVVSSSLGLDPKDEQRDSELRLRIAVSVVGRWLDHWLMPGQNVFIDAPHVAATFPSALPTADAGTNWKHLSADDYLIANSPLGTLPRADSPFLQRAAWRLSEVRELARKHPIPQRQVQMAFCEDVSDFQQTDDAYEIDTDVAGPFNRRYVKRIDDVRYYPLTRLYA